MIALINYHLNTVNMRFTLVLLTTFFVGFTYGNDPRWKDCKDTFCERLRGSPGNTKVSYSVDLATLTTQDNKLVGDLKPSITNAATLTLTLSVLEEKICHISIDQKEPSTPARYKARDALLDGGSKFKIVKLTDSGKNEAEVSFTYDDLKITIYKSPMKFEFYKNNTLFSVVNANNRFVFETDTTDVAVGLDISFKNVQRAYGLPEHADHLSLRTTVKEEPYRHFNLDYGSYELDSTQALYGAIGVLYAHGNKFSSGAFWLNAAQTWTDITNGPNHIDAYFMSESGVLDLFILSGPTLPQAVKQYTTLTGTAPLPQYFTLGYHQSRYSYMDQAEVVDVVKNFDEKLLPIDVMWLDIDYTDEKKYFTWDPVRFKDPKKLIDDLAKTNRKLVAIIDPHIKTDNEYFLHKEAKGKYYVRDSSGQKDFEGECWPGMSSYLDFLNPAAREYYSKLYLQHHFENKNVHVWNDMNEPAVFNRKDDENSIPLNAVHHDKYKHRDVHNIYGFYQTVGTREGMLQRKDKVRPFILTRSHFAGTQRYAAVWTGDNVATWDYMKISFPMCLTEALAGISFCGADVGGFSGIPDDELYQRWYQAGAWLPFYRGHSALDVPRREPYLYGDDIQGRIRAALHQRYIHIPIWYTLFYEHEKTGEPVIRPITYHYPAESDAFDIEHEVLIGQNILAAPVMDKGVFHHKVYLPGGSGEVWYNIDDNFKPYNGTGSHLIQVNLNSMPVFYKAGSIISRKDAPKLTSVDTHKDPYTLYIVLNGNGYAEGKLYVDDGETFSYDQDKKYYYVNFVFDNNTLTAKHLSNATYADAAPITNLVIINPPQSIKRVKQIQENSPIDLNSSYNEKRDLLFVTNFTAKLQDGIDIKFTSSASVLTLSIGTFIAVCISIVYNI